MTEKYIGQMRAILAAKSWTQQDLANELGVTFVAVNRWLNQRAVPQPAHLRHIGELHREFVGLKDFTSAELKKIIRQSNRLKMPGIKTLLKKQPLIQDEILVDASYNSNTIEGTTLSFRETQVLIQNKTAPAHRPWTDQLVISNHAALLRDILSTPPVVLDRDLIYLWHQRLFQGIMNNAGQYATTHRGVLGLNIKLTHPSDIAEEMEIFLKQAMKPGKKPFILHLAETHATFELIHPFSDGNGRIGRLILMAQCLAHDFPPPIIENTRKAQYYEVLEEAQRRKPHHLALFLREEMERTQEILLKNS